MSGGSKVQLGSRVNESSAPQGAEVDKGHSEADEGRGSEGARWGGNMEVMTDEEWQG